ncbi:hypothetical protein OG474_05650 [Kribbella sp. NBC_01505]|uniref:hypothetical protein n=1 Tax=Kribbella sp. NBC_01505 TaxID=2903580 RepID=UPI003869DEF7
MIDEQQLMDRLTDAAAAQDDLLPRALADDLNAGRRRLRRRRFLVAGTAVVAAGAVAVATIGVNGVLKDTAQLEPPVATQQAPVNTQSAEDAIVKARTSGFDALMKSLLVKHLDPAKKHLDFSVGPFVVGSDIGAHGTGRKVGWNVAGDKGQGMLFVSLFPYAKGGDVCGGDGQPVVTCHQITLTNGRKAMFGRDGKAAQLSYVQPDGETAFLSIDPLFGNNTTIPVKRLDITDEQMIAWATDPRLNLPPLSAGDQAKEDKLKDFAPTRDQIVLATAERIPGKYVSKRLDDLPTMIEVVQNWSRGSTTAEVSVSVYAAPVAMPCVDAPSGKKCLPVKLPNGGQGEFYEAPHTYQGGPMYEMQAAFTQPDGDQARVRVLYPGKKKPPNAITKEQILALVADPALDR